MSPSVAELLASYQQVRAQSEALCAPLAVEDYGVQPMDDASPPKWHLAHTSWFFETFLLRPMLAGYRPFDAQFEYLFNSYYNGVGAQFPRTRRGHLSRPTVAQVYAYRAHVDAAMQTLLEQSLVSSEPDGELLQRLVLGLHHEQQHQELMLTDLKYAFGHNPLFPNYCPAIETAPKTSGLTASDKLNFVSCPGGIVSVGADSTGFCFDNELPRHEVLLAPYALANRPVSNGEYRRFIADGGYQRPELWLSNAWTTVCEQAWKAPLYWHKRGGEDFEYRLDGLHKLDDARAVMHVSYYEADAYARWAGARLPTEFEWEAAATSGQSTEGSAANAACNFVESKQFHSRPAGQGPSQGPFEQLFGDVWEWTQSSYGPYPGYRPLPGTLGEYNGKFMSEQLVLRGGSCFTPADHLRASYRNFFYPPDRWQASGIRLAQDVSGTDGVR
ncbi:MAG: ergothioneine biosynthesis protein EgtB [Pseudomonadales bacterium]